MRADRPAARFGSRAALAGGLVVALGFSGLTGTTALAVAQNPASPVRIATAELRRLSPTVSVSGQVQSHSTADMAASVEGNIAWVADVGTPVKQGEVVARLDTAQLSLQRTELAARVTRAQFALKQAQREYERLSAAGDAITREQLDLQENSRDLARSDLEIAKATQHELEEKLSRMQFRAPFTGVVVERVKRAGEYAAIGDVVARLAGNGGLEIHLFMPLRHVRAIVPGGEVAVHLEGNDARAPVKSVVPVGDAKSQSFEIVLDAQRIEPLPAVGALVYADLPLGTPQQLLAVPRDALIIRAEGMSVFRVQGGKAEKVTVKPGVADGDWIAVDGGLVAGDKVVTRGGESLHDQDKVQVLAAPSI
ncbi:MAG: efflux RND transporter periplasmic adaptor subunit [Nevskia sp.]|nr:efflux RND transporter periplasmic adaptor subunit [Nevskia sp.]